MELQALLTPERVVRCDQTLTKKQSLERISDIASQFDEELKYSSILSALQQRERLGSTAIGHGIAIPHARIPELTEPIAVLLLLDNPIDFGSDEHNGIDVVFALLVPEKEDVQHIEALKAITSHLQDSEYRQRLRQTQTNLQLYQAACTDG